MASLIAHLAGKVTADILCASHAAGGGSSVSLHRTRLAVLWALVAFGAAALQAQDPFEIQIYEYRTVPKRMWNLETHLNYVGRGTKNFEGTVAPTNNQLHMTYELTRGLTDHFELAGYLVTGRRPGTGDIVELAAWRVRPRVRLPQSWGLPVDISLSTEVAFPRKAYDENAATLEIRPIIEKTFGRFQIDLNPVIGRVLRGPGTSEGWDFEPGVRMAYTANAKFKPSLEYYGSTGPVFNPVVTDEQVHLFYPGADIQIADNVVWNVGLGLAATPAGNHLIYKMRIGVLFGGIK
jgi:hypothetical protein